MSTLDSSFAEAHPITPRDRDTMLQLRAMILPNKGKMRGTAARPFYETIMNRVAAPEGVAFRADTVGGIAGWWCEPVGARAGAVLLHLHGGWFNWGSAQSFRHLVGHIAFHAGARAFVPDYRLAPEHPFPAAPEDVLACYQGLLGRGARAIALSGDSAGGNLALGLLQQLAQRPPAERPVGTAVLSPVTDLAMTGASWETRAAADPFFIREQAEELVRAYLGGRNPRLPMASPLFGDLAGLPPIRIHVGDDEVLLDDSLRYAARAIAAGVDLKVDVWEGMPHGFVGNVGRLDAASAALDAIGIFLSTQFAAGNPA